MLISKYRDATYIKVTFRHIYYWEFWRNKLASELWLQHYALESSKTFWNFDAHYFVLEVKDAHKDILA